MPNGDLQLSGVNDLPKAPQIQLSVVMVVGGVLICDSLEILELSHRKLVHEQK